MNPHSLIEHLRNIQQVDAEEANATATAYVGVGGTYIAATMCSRTDFEQWLQNYNDELRRAHRFLHRDCGVYK